VVAERFRDDKRCDPEAEPDLRKIIIAVFSLLFPVYIFSTPLFINYVSFHMHVLALAAVPGPRRTFEQGPAYIAYDFWPKLWTFSHPFQMFPD
jgi:hypothetical protein